MTPSPLQALALEHLRTLVAFDTQNPGGDEPRLCEWLAARLRAAGPDELDIVQIDTGGVRHASVFAAWGAPRLLVNAHLDTVPRNHGWTHDPLALHVEAGRAYGLGAADTKGATAAFLAALERAPGPPRGLAVLFSGDEEHGTVCLDAFVRSERGRALSDARVPVLVCEPTRLRAGTRHRGIVAVRATRTGEGGHSSRADHMVAPIADLARLAVAWAEHGRAHRDAGPEGFRGLCLNVAALDGGVAFNVVPARAELTVSVRPPPGLPAADARRALVALAAATVPEATCEALLERPAFATRDLATFRPFLGDALDAPVDLGFWTEAAVLAGAGFDAVVWGPGDIAQAHAADEWVELEQLGAAADTFARLVRGAEG